ncbi:hypothetical protein QWZ03_09895 [Chitinimonas viridis]|uniref:Uncharacterized protein n=1 Tax=Chitinimonas viridis TaxID=664880 RepID=A0ABT8B5X8_9NEIS|nr:hypothetical protein [Chitinimonas viridis]MDN3577076.1 hypothetical protein [Chitinimonas viridis]
MTKRSKLKLYAVVVLVGGLLLGSGIWLNGGDSLDYVSTSPKYEKYRLEIYAAKRYQALLNRGMVDPGYVLLYDNTQNKLLQRSDIVDLTGNAEVRWSLDQLGEVSVGMDVRWQLAPE